MENSTAGASHPTVVLIHGAFGGPWYWDLVIPELRRLGLDSLAVDLPIDDPAAAAETFAELTAEAASGLDEAVVVAHSMSGTFAPLVAERLPAKHLIFVGAALPKVGMSLFEQFGQEPLMLGDAQAAFRYDDDARFSLSPEDAKRMLFHDSPESLADWASTRLRPQSSLIANETSPLKEWPDVPVSYILGTEDRMMPPAWARAAVPERLGVTPIEIPTGHAPFFSRPELLAGIIAEISIKGEYSGPGH